MIVMIEMIDRDARDDRVLCCILCHALKVKQKNTKIDIEKYSINDRFLV